MNSNKPVLLTDCDGVLVEWLSSVPAFLESIGLECSALRTKVEAGGNPFIPFQELFMGRDEAENLERFLEYNNSHFMADLPVMQPGSQDALKRLAGDVDIVVVTCLRDTEQARQYRIQNLEKLYGRIFADVICLAHDGDKAPVLQHYAESRDVVLWLDDQVKQVKRGLEVGIPSFQFTYGMNCGRDTGEVNTLPSWEAVESMVSRRMEQDHWKCPGINHSVIKDGHSHDVPTFSGL